MKITRRQLRRIIREAVSSRPEPYEGYVKDTAEMYIEKMDGQREDFDGYLEFGAKHGYDEEQLGRWFDAAHSREYNASLESRDSYINQDKVRIGGNSHFGKDMLRGGVDSDELKDDLESDRIDLQRNPYALD